MNKTHTKNLFTSELEGLRQFQDHCWKALGEENSDLFEGASDHWQIDVLVS